MLHLLRMHNGIWPSKWLMKTETARSDFFRNAQESHATDFASRAIDDIKSVLGITKEIGAEVVNAMRRKNSFKE